MAMSKFHFDSRKDSPYFIAQSFYSELKYSARSVFPPNVSASCLRGSHHGFSPRRFFMSACSSTSVIGAKITDDPWTVMTAAEPRVCLRDLSFRDFIFTDCSSKNVMHFIERRTARARSSGEGMPPCNVCPSEAERESNKDPPSSLRILVITSVV